MSGTMIRWIFGMLTWRLLSRCPSLTAVVPPHQPGSATAALWLKVPHRDRLPVCWTRHGLSALCQGRNTHNENEFAQEDRSGRGSLRHIGVRRHSARSTAKNPQDSVGGAAIIDNTGCSQVLRRARGE